MKLKVESDGDVSLRWGIFYTYGSAIKSEIFPHGIFYFSCRWRWMEFIFSINSYQPVLYEDDLEYELAAMPKPRRESVFRLLSNGNFWIEFLGLGVKGSASHQKWIHPFGWIEFYYLFKDLEIDFSIKSKPVARLNS